MVSLPLGAVRLTEEFLQNDPPKKKELERMRQFIAEETGRWEQRIRRRGMQMAIATSGTAETLAALADTLERHREEKNYVSRAAMSKIVRGLSKRACPKASHGRHWVHAALRLSSPAHMVYHDLVERFNLPGFVYSPSVCATACWPRWLAEHDR